MTEPLAPDDLTWVEVTVTCSTEGCGNAGHAIPLTIPEGTPVSCGVCGALLMEGR